MTSTSSVSILLIFFLFWSVLPAQPQSTLSTAQTVQLAHPGARALVCYADSAGTNVQLWFTTADGLFLQRQNSLLRLSPDGARVVQVQFSRQQRFLAALQFFDDRPGNGNRWLIQVFRNDGTIQTELSLPRYHDEPFPVLQVADSGERLYLIHPGTALLQVYDHRGRKLLDRPLFKEAPFDYERAVMMSLSADGESLAVAAMASAARPDHPAPQQNSRLWLLNRDGQVQWHMPLPERSLYALHLSASGRYVAIASYDSYAPGGMIRRIRIFDRNGRRLRNLAGLFDIARFDDGQWFFYSDAHALFRLDLSAGDPDTLYVVDDAGQKILQWLPSPGFRSMAVAVAQPVFHDTGFQFDRAQILRIPAESGAPVTQLYSGSALTSPFLLQLPDLNRFAITTEYSLQLNDWKNDD